MPRKNESKPTGPANRARRPAKASNAPRVARQRAAPRTPAPAPSKASTVLGALRRPAGASLEELTQATGWQAHSVRGFLSGTVRRKLGLSLTVETSAGGRRYHLPAG